MTSRGEKKPSTSKRMIIMIVGVIALMLVIAGVWLLKMTRMDGNTKPPPPAVVSTAKAEYQNWQPTLSAVGTLRAVRGADLALDIAGLVTKVNIESGADVKEGQLLLQLRDAEDVASLHQLEATAALAQATFDRAKRQLAMQTVSKADYDVAIADLDAKQAAVQQQQVNVAKKQLRAPFSGRAGMVTVNPGAYLNSGMMIVTLQQLDPLYVDFFIPQRDLGELKIGQKVQLTLDAFAGNTFDGSVTAISPKVEGDTRNVQVEAIVPNPERTLLPGMFANVTVDVGGTQRYLTLPQTAVVFNPYGETVFVVVKQSQVNDANAATPALGKDDGAKPVEGAKKDAKDDATPDAKSKGTARSPPDALVVQQAFVTTGPKRGDQVAILKGLDEGTQVVTTGQVKLKSGVQVTVDNSVQPENNPSPKPQEQ